MMTRLEKRFARKFGKIENLNDNALLMMIVFFYVCFHYGVHCGGGRALGTVLKVSHRIGSLVTSFRTLLKIIMLGFNKCLFINEFPFE